LNKVCEQGEYAIPFKHPRSHSNAKISVDVNMKMSISRFAGGTTHQYGVSAGSSKTVSAVAASLNPSARRICR